MDPAEQVVKRLMTTVKCSVCGSCYESEKISVLGHQDEIWFLSVTCGNCRTQGLVAALLKDATKGGPEYTPISPLEKKQAGEPAPKATRIPRPSKVTAGDVLEMREFLKGFDGNFGRLFGDGDKQSPR